MSRWGVFDSEGEQHIAPCDDAGNLLPPHEIARTCQCHPRVDPQCASQWIHHDPERGGFDA